MDPDEELVKLTTSGAVPEVMGDEKPATGAPTGSGIITLASFEKLLSIPAEL